MIAWMSIALAAERHALVAAAADGGPDRALLRYADADARRMADVLTAVGGVDRDRIRLLLGPTAGEVRDALADLGADLERDDEVVLYFTGHADPAGLRFGREQLSYDELRAAVDALPAGVRLVVIDGCASGAVLREKGGAFEAPIPVRQAVDGVAYLTSSAADEVSQESDAIGGSFFTHALATALLGAADRSGDGTVTLGEAYRYTYDHTLASTERTIGGAQHPSFDLRMAGAGELVLSRPATTRGQLRLPSTLGDAVTVRRAGGEVVAELIGARDADTLLALPPGRYDLVVRDGEGLAGATVSVGDLRATTADPADLRRLPEPVVRQKGARSPVGPLLLGIAAAGVVGTAVSWDGYVRSQDGSQAYSPSFPPLLFFGTLTVLSTTTFVIREGAR